MIFIVAKICRGRTTANGATVAMVKDSSMSLMALTRSASNTAMPWVSEIKLARPVNASAARTPVPVAAVAKALAASSS